MAEDLGNLKINLEFDSSSIKKLNKNIKGSGVQYTETENRVKKVRGQIERWSSTMRTLLGQYKMLGLIGLGTLAAMIVNTPLIAAAFKIVGTAMTAVITILSTGVLPWFIAIANVILDIGTYIEDSPLLGSLVKWFVAGTMVLAVMVLIGNAIFLTAYAITNAKLAFIDLFMGIVGKITIIEEKLNNFVSWITKGKNRLKTVRGFLTKIFRIFRKILVPLWVFITLVKNIREHGFTLTAIFKTLFDLFWDIVFVIADIAVAILDLIFPSKEISKIWEKMRKEFLDKMWDKALSGARRMLSYAKDIFEWIKKLELPSFTGGFMGKGQTGMSYVPADGIYQLERGEKVITPGNNTSNKIDVSVNVAGGISSNVDINRIADVVSEKIAAKVSRRV